MVPEWRRAYNRAWSEEGYQGYLAALAQRYGGPVPFRLAETPVFFTARFRETLLAAAHDVVGLLLSDEHQRRSLAAVPPELSVPGCDRHPLFAQIDFAVVAGPDGAPAVRLIELQAFPSLYAFQLHQGRELRRLVPGGEGLRFLYDRRDEDEYVRLLGEAILGGHAPEDVVLLDLDPLTQKTWPDFAATEAFWGVRAVCPTRVTKRGRELWYERDGKPRRIARIYNRVIVDELAVKGVELPFRWTDPLDVEWAGHPNWYFRWSKHSLPWLRHPAVPEAHLLSELQRWPDDLERWVLKPLFSFAGSGVKVDVTRDDLERVDEAERSRTLLMRKVDYAPVIETADGECSKAEVRVMFLWVDGEPRPLTNLVRLSQGKMMGVDYNKGRTWVGSSTALWEE